MELTDAVRLRTSGAPITGQAPDDAQLAAAISLAAHSPDHAALRPWRLVTLRGDERRRLGAAIATGFGEQPGSPAAEKSASKPLRAPLLLGIIARIQQHPKVPEWEQIAATAGFVTTLELVLFDAGFTAMWRTGPPATLPEVHAVMGVAEDEKLLGWLYIGATDPGTVARTGDPDVRDRVSALPPA